MWTHLPLKVKVNAATCVAEGCAYCIERLYQGPKEISVQRENDPSELPNEKDCWSTITRKSVDMVEQFRDDRIQPESSRLSLIN